MSLARVTRRVSPGERRNQPRRPRSPGEASRCHTARVRSRAMNDKPSNAGPAIIAPPKQRPSLGRQVRFWHGVPLVEHTATISYVHSDTCVNLSVLEHNGGSMFGRTSVLLADGDDEAQRRGHWTWPEFTPPARAST